MAKYLVTGGAGFIGSHLVEYLLGKGDEVVVIDDLSTGRLDNIEHLEDNPKFDYVIDSVTHEALLVNLVEQADRIFHLASAVGVKLVMDAPVQAIEATLYGTEVVLNAASGSGKKVLITSSSEVYGKNNAVPFREDSDLTFGPTTVTRWCYGCAKTMDEFLALAYWRQEKLPVVLARLFNTVGPRQTGLYGMVLPRFVEQALTGGPLTVFGDGSQTRCFCSVSDVVEALYALMHSDAASGEVVNVGTDREIAIMELAKLVRSRVNPKAEIRCVPYKQVYGEDFEDLGRRVPDLVKVKRLIGWEARMSLEETIDRVAEQVGRRLEGMRESVSGRPRGSTGSPSRGKSRGRKSKPPKGS